MGELLMSSESIYRLDAIVAEIREKLKERALEKVRSENRKRLELEDVESVKKEAIAQYLAQ